MMSPTTPSFLVSLACTLTLSTLVTAGTPNTVNPNSKVCFTSGPDFNVGDATNNWLDRIIDGHTDQEIDGFTQLHFDFGSSRLCIENNFVFENTHFDAVVVGEAGHGIVTDCCSHDIGASCIGGQFQIFGDSGLALNVVMQSTSLNCDGSPA